MIRLIPPVAVSASGPSIAGSLLDGTETDFADQVKRRVGLAAASFFPSGRAALAHVLSGYRRGARDEVVIPAYTCWSVAASIVRAGLRVRIADVDPLTLDYLPEALDSACNDRTVAVVAAHLFARTADTDRVAAAAAGCGARWVEDAAQAIPVASSGADAVVLSFGRGKPLALGGGGALLTAEQVDCRDESRFRGGGLVAALKLAMTSCLGRPAWYRLPRALPFLAIGATVYDPDFSAEGPLYRWQARLGARLLAESQAADERRAHHARRLIRAVARCAGWTVPAAAAIAAGPLRLPLLAPGRVARDRTRARLLRMGVDASVMYPATINRIPGIGPHLAGSATTGGAQQLVDRLLTLPTYPTLAGGDLRRIEDAFVSAAESS